MLTTVEHERCLSLLGHIAVLSNPSDYWISVINVGRSHSLQDIINAYGDENLTAGQVYCLIVSLLWVFSLLICAVLVVVVVSLFCTICHGTIDFLHQV